MKTKTKRNTTTAARKADTYTIDSDLVHVGLDWGTNTSCIYAAGSEDKEAAFRESIPTVVGYAKEGIINGVLPDDARMLFGQEALKRRLHLNVVYPMQNGIIHNLEASRHFIQHVRDRMNLSPDAEVRAVVGVPANSDNASRENMRLVLGSVFDKVILIPEPFLAALGYRDDEKLGHPDYPDPVGNSLYIDIGAGSTDVCMIQGYYPTTEDQISFAFAGDAVDALLQKMLQQKYPDCHISLSKIREIKEVHSFVMNADNSVLTTLMIGGKAKKLEVGEEIGAACDELLRRVFEAVKALIVKADPDSVSELLGNIIVTGGGSLIKGFGIGLQTMLIEEGFENPKVRTMGRNYKEFVAKGAIKAARQAAPHHWQTLIR